MGSGDNNGFVHCLEARLRERSDELENLHMEAAIDAQVTTTEGGNPIVSGGNETEKEIIFDDYTNPNAVENCLSPYEPSSAERIEAFCRWANLTSSDVLLDIGCGDGRVCVAASRISGMSTIIHENYACLYQVLVSLLISCLQVAGLLAWTSLLCVSPWPRTWLKRRAWRSCASFMK